MNKQKQKGYIILMNTFAFLAISMVLLIGVAGPILSSFSIGKAFLKSKESFLIANSASEEALYRLKTGRDLSASENLDLAGGSATINTGDFGDEKIVTIASTVENFERNLQVKVTQGVGVSFNYGTQAGQGGFEMSGGAGIYGNVYSNGDIVGSGSPFITGSAAVANTSDPVAHQSNNGDVAPAYSVNYGGNTTPQDAAMSFRVFTSTPVTSIRFYIKKNNNSWMNNTTVRIVTDNSGSPSQTTVASGTISASQVTTAYNYLSVPFASNPVLNQNTTYWIVFDTATTWGNYYTLAATNDTYTNGVMKSGTWSSGTWNSTSPATLDAYFELYVGGDTGLISGVSVGSDGGDAWAHDVKNSTVLGKIYCQGGSGNNKSCDTSRADPVQQPMPISDGNIEEWKNVAEAGEIFNGDKIYSGDDNEIIGPMKIDGDLEISDGATLTLAGTVWVTGNVTLTGAGEIKLGANYGAESGILVADGRIDMQDGGTMQGSGTTGSYLLAVTTSECPYSGSCGGNPAISVSGGTGSVVLNAQNGNLEFTGGADAKQITAKKVIMDGGTTVSYESGLANINFYSGPSGSYNLISWDEVE